MDVYRAETQEIIRRFLAGKFTQDQCAAALYAAFTGVLPEIKAEDLRTLRVIVADNERMMKRRRYCSQAVNSVTSR